MSHNDLKLKLSEKVQAFTAKCEEQQHAIEQKKEQERKKEEEQAKRKEDVAKKFDDTILKDLRHLFTEIKPAFSSPYLEIILDTHDQHEHFYILDDDEIPAFASLAVDAKAKVDGNIFDYPRYLFFVTSISSNSFALSLNNECREVLRFGAHEDDESTLLQTYSFDDYDFNEIRGHIEKYLTDELTYLQKNFKIRRAEWED
ncbi:hypothetical protein [Sphingobacterium corticibacterium]|uniref:Uncharacterized protein n=1 Tax=Sphingobacterium corticibacterium TaxID=2484746 RepID=A0A4Q6XL30_9SPHI|nr:hypothetical protein [Sphingobacterium corticibacterium]RZF57874.1 hypothetical protein EWE74_19575 [Sphingobacterium corticibacterium]